jgi:polyisoprenoid-binding protein YceI
MPRMHDPNSTSRPQGPAADRRPHGRSGRRPVRTLPAVMLAALLALPWLAGPAAPAAAQLRSYTIDAHASSLQVLLRRRGLFSALAHDHVLVAQGFAGRVSVDPADLSRSALQVTIPVASLQVDPPEARKALGLEGTLDDADRAKVRESMLAPDQLDAARSPRVTATLAGVSGQLPALVLAVRVRIREVERLLSIPAQVELAGDELHASGEASLLQSVFGIVPYSTLLGAVAVQDRVVVRFRIVARADAG